MGPMTSASGHPVPSPVAPPYAPYYTYGSAPVPFPAYYGQTGYGQYHYHPMVGTNAYAGGAAGTVQDPDAAVAQAPAAPQL